MTYTKGRCCYCGKWAHSTAYVCIFHEYLLRLDPIMLLRTKRR